MNNLFYVIDKATGEIQASGLDIVYTLHLFLQGLPFKKLEIKPSTGSETINIPTTGGFDDDTPRLSPVEGEKIFDIHVDEKIYTLFLFSYERGQMF